jgi:hypothetical protein
MRTAQGATRPTTQGAAVRAVLVAILLGCASGASCARSLRNPFSPLGPPAPEVLVAVSSLEQILAAVNQNSQRVQTYQTNNATISFPGSPGIPSLRGHIAAQRPLRFRLEANMQLTGVQEVSLGSNDELFWFWVRRSEPPALYYARHDQAVGSAAQQLMPIDPQWLLDALGMAEFKPTDSHEGPRPVEKNAYEIKSIVQSRMGPLVKRTVVDAHAWVLEQHLYDGAGTLLASASARSHRYYPETGVSLPQEVEIRIPAAELALSIDVGTVELNRLHDNPQLWTMPANTGAPAVNLGVAPPSMPGGGASPLGSQLIGANWYDPAPDATPSLAGSIPAAPMPVASMAMPVASGSEATVQFVPPGGVAASMPDPFVSQPPMSVQRLPGGGVPAAPILTR